MEDVVPLHGLRISLRLPGRARCRDVSLAVAGGVLPHEEKAGRVRFTLPVLTEFESVLVRLE
jgi:hypothetical protein